VEPELQIEPLIYQPIYQPYFDAGRPNAGDYAKGFALFAGSLIQHTLFGPSRGLFELPEEVRWGVGMVVLWGEEDELRTQLRAATLARIQEFQPDIIMAHSLGSLICYDTFVHQPDALQGRDFLTFGSQIGNPAVLNTFGGRQIGLPDAREWIHLHDPCDRVLTAGVRDRDANFLQVEITGSDPFAVSVNHSMEHYLQHPATRAAAWPRLVERVVQPQTPLVRGFSPHFKEAAQPATRRALLIGINDYPDPANRLEGCVNDVFLMSATLQECGFGAEDIRVVLNDRATADGIRERLRWLLEDVKDGDERVLFYSGHGAQLPAYNAKEVVDHMDECLVPWDFDWTTEKAITDDEFLQYYSVLPYGSYFVSIFDCCHSGGMERGPAGRPRGLEPPDDIRHRLLCWDPAEQTWKQRALPPAAQAITAEQRPAFVGRSGAKVRLGRGIGLRQSERHTYNRVREQLDHKGPYLPVILEACGEDQLAYEYKHGVTPYGAFTYLLTNRLRLRRVQGKTPTFATLIQDVNKGLTGLSYPQKAAVVGPDAVVKAQIPFNLPARTPGASSSAAVSAEGRSPRAPRKR
jgi:hypothetical protein